MSCVALHSSITRNCARSRYGYRNSNSISHPHGPSTTWQSFLLCGVRLMDKTIEQKTDELLAKARFKPKAKNGAGSRLDGSHVGAELIVQCAADITPEPVEWLWPGRV